MLFLLSLIPSINLCSVAFSSISNNFECGFYSIIISSLRYRFNYWLILFHFLIFEQELILALLLIYGISTLNSNVIIVVVYIISFIDLFIYPLFLTVSMLIGNIIDIYLSGIMIVLINWLMYSGYFGIVLCSYLLYLFLTRMELFLINIINFILFIFILYFLLSWIILFYILTFCYYWMTCFWFNYWLVIFYWMILILTLGSVIGMIKYRNLLLKFFLCFESFFFIMSVIVMIWSCSSNGIIIVLYLLWNSTFEVILGLTMSFLVIYISIYSFFYITFRSLIEYEF